MRKSKARPFNIEWARQTIEQCKAAKVACFVKQCGSNIRAPYYEKDDAATVELARQIGFDLEG